MDTLFVGANAIPWTTIDQTVYVDYQVAATAIYYRKYFFFDWTNWKYYTVNEVQNRKELLRDGLSARMEIGLSEPPPPAGPPSPLA